MRPRRHGGLKPNDTGAGKEFVVTAVEVDLPNGLSLGAQHGREPLKERPHRALQQQGALMAQEEV